MMDPAFTAEGFFLGFQVRKEFAAHLTFEQLKNTITSCLQINRIMRTGKNTELILRIAGDKKIVEDKACQKTNWRELDCLSMLKEHLIDITGQNEEFGQKIKTFDIDQTMDYEVFGGMSFDQYLDQMLKPVAQRMIKVRNLKYLFEQPEKQKESEEIKYYADQAV